MPEILNESQRRRQIFEAHKEDKVNASQQMLVEYYNNMSDQNLQDLRNKDTYEHEVEQVKQIEGSVNYNSTHISSMRQAINEVMPQNQYRNLQLIQTSLDKRDRTKKLHHSLGTRLLRENHDVVEFDIAGSGTYNFRKYHNGYHGNLKTKHTEEQRQRQLGEHLNVGEAGSELYTFWGKIKRFFGNIFGIKTPPLWIRRKKTSITADKVKENARNMGMTHGLDTRKFQDRQKIRYNVAGPLGGVVGFANVGEYSIQNTRQRILDMGKAFLTQRFTQWIHDGDNADFHNIDLMFKGHSRGGVGSVQGAMMLKRWIHDNYPQYEGYVIFHITQHDPVAGIGSNWGGFEKINHVDKKNGNKKGEADITIDGQKMRTLGESAESTVFYSMNTSYSRSLFAPQEVMNAKRVILVPFNHGVHNTWDNVDFSQIGKETDEELRNGFKEKGHEMAFKDAKTGEVYRRSGIDKLKEGLYVSDEYGVLIEITSMKDLYKLLDKVLPQDRNQWDRYKTITKVAAKKLGVPWTEDEFRKHMVLHQHN